MEGVEAARGECTAMRLACEQTCGNHTALGGAFRGRTRPVFSRSLFVFAFSAYEQLSGVPVLCNTSANMSGRGFFPDALSAMRWGRTRYVLV